MTRDAAQMSLDVEDDRECLVYGAQLAGVEPSGRATEPLRVDDGRLFDNDPCKTPVECDHRAKGRRASAGRGGRDERGREVQELVGLHYHRVAGAALLVLTGAFRGGQVEYLAADHRSVHPFWSKADHLLTDDAHLLAVTFVSREMPHFLTKGRADSPACCGLPQCDAYGLRVTDAAGANDIERGCGDVIKPDVQ